MSELDNYDATSERVENASTEVRLEKFAKIVALLKTHGIKMIDFTGSAVVLEDATCGYTVHHGFISWEIYRVVDVVDMIVKGRDNYITQLKTPDA